MTPQGRGEVPAPAPSRLWLAVGSLLALASMLLLWPTLLVLGFQGERHAAPYALGSLALFGVAVAAFALAIRGKRLARNDARRLE